jgi:hypothetical protein
MMCSTGSDVLLMFAIVVMERDGRLIVRLAYRGYKHAVKAVVTVVVMAEKSLESTEQRDIPSLTTD